MIGPSIDPEEVGVTGLIWLFISYGYALSVAADLISEGSELLLLVPSMAGLVGGVVLPLLGAVPDGAIILFSGLGSLEVAQDTLSVGVGALAGSTIMLLTVPLPLSVYGGRVNINESNGMPNYHGRPKLTPKTGIAQELSQTGVAVTEAVSKGAMVMIVTCLPYFLIQVPAMFLHGPTEEVAEGERWWALGGLVICLAGLVYYMLLQLDMSRRHEDRDKRVAVFKRQIKKGAISLSGGLAAEIKKAEKDMEKKGGSEYQSISNDTQDYPPPSVAEFLKVVLREAFKNYDTNGDGTLDRKEAYVLLCDFHETITAEEMDDIFDMYDADGNGAISMTEFISVVYKMIKMQMAAKDAEEEGSPMDISNAHKRNMMKQAFSDEEEEDIPDEFTHLSPDQQQAAIKKKAFLMLAGGTAMVVYFSDPMVDVLAAIAGRVHLSPFYVSFVLAPLASNASEFVASMYYASKKTSKTMTVSLSALTGAACMNNTFCLSIFMGLVFFRGLAWQYTAETIAIVVVVVTVALLLRRKKLTLGTASFILCLFPLSIVLVAGLEALGFD